MCKLVSGKISLIHNIEYNKNKPNNIFEIRIE